MIKRKNASILAVSVAAAFLAAAPGAQASDFSGYAAGVKAGLNFASDGTTSATAFTLGVEGSYLTRAQGLPSNVLIGGDVFLDFNTSASRTLTTTDIFGNVYSLSYSYGTNVLGADAKVGYVMGNLMPYAKLGLADIMGTGDASGSATGVHLGLGAEYRLSQTLGATAEWSYDSASGFDNNNLTVGVNYHF